MFILEDLKVQENIREKMPLMAQKAIIINLLYFFSLLFYIGTNERIYSYEVFCFFNVV